MVAITLLPCLLLLPPPAAACRVAAGLSLDIATQKPLFCDIKEGKRAYFVTNSLFYRPLLEDLRRWRNDPNRKPLVVRGARQVGKSCLVRLFAGVPALCGAESGKALARRPMFRRGLSLSELIQADYAGVPGTGKAPRRCSCFSVRFRRCRAVAMLRFFQEERPDLHVIAAGSLLETRLRPAAISFPVGRSAVFVRQA